MVRRAVPREIQPCPNPRPGSIPRRSPRVSRVSPSLRNSSTSTALSAGGASASSPAPNPSGEPNATCLCVRSSSVKNARSLAAAAVASLAAENAASAHEFRRRERDVRGVFVQSDRARSLPPTRERPGLRDSKAAHGAPRARFFPTAPRAPWSPRRRPTAPACARPAVETRARGTALPRGRPCRWRGTRGAGPRSSNG